MKTRVDARFLAEVRTWKLAFTCERCAHFVVESKACANGYPNAAHHELELATSASVEFCKEFELA